MTDIVDSATRSRMMATIRGRDTKPERRLRSALWRAGFRFRLHAKNVPGKPDVVLPKWRAVVFVHGCFWHAHTGCRYFRLPGTRPEFWGAKLHANRIRDERVLKELIAEGWRVFIVWECSMRSNEAKVIETLGMLIVNRDDNAYEIREDVGSTGIVVATIHPAHDSDSNLPVHGAF